MKSLKSFRRWITAPLMAVVLLTLFGCGLVSVDIGSALGTPTPDLSGPAQAPTIDLNANPPANQAPSAPSGTLVPLPQNAPLLQPSGNLETDIQAVAQHVRPAVVFVGIEANLRSFGQPVPVGNGSGAIIDAQGHILTNNHVVEQAQALKVTLPDGRTFDARVVGRDPASDLAVIQIQGNNLPVLPLGDSDKLQIGEWVVAIGNALGLEGGPTVTKGVVSALNRTITEDNGASIPGLIQTDAAINPGNSGGPLVNLRGELVGINTAVPGPTGQGVQPSGIGFAISINEAKPIIQQLLTSGRVTRPYLGVAPVTITPAIRAQLGLSADKGVILDTVAPNSPAARAGLQQGDVIVAADGNPLVDEAALRQAIASHRIGDTMRLTVLRSGRQMDVQVQLAQAPAP
ncbi:MAG TPA: trypsin-like peptidase domain-containing protein [Anaerolineae bacterium]